MSSCSDPISQIEWSTVTISEYVDTLRLREVERVRGDTFEHVLYNTYQTIRANLVKICQTPGDPSEPATDMIESYAFDHRRGWVNRYGIGRIGEPHGYGTRGLGYPEIDLLVREFEDAMGFSRVVPMPNGQSCQKTYYDIEKGRQYYKDRGCIIPDAEITSAYKDDVALVELSTYTKGSRFHEGLTVECFNPAERAKSPREFSLDMPTHENTFFSLFLCHQDSTGKPIIQLQDLVYRLDTNALAHKLRYRREGFFVRLDQKVIESLLPFAQLMPAPYGIPVDCGNHIANREIAALSGSKQYPEEWIQRDEFLKEYGDRHVSGIACLNEGEGWWAWDSPNAFLRTCCPENSQYIVRATLRHPNEGTFFIKKIPKGLHRQMMRIIEIEWDLRQKMGLITNFPDGSLQHDFAYVDLRFQNANHPFIFPANRSPENIDGGIFT